MKKILALLLVLAMALSFAACGGKTENVEPTDAANPDVTEDTPSADDVAVMTHDEYVAAEIDSKVCVETYVQAKQSWWDNKATLYTQAEDGAYFIYNMPCTEDEYADLTPGTKIKVTGYKSEWSGEVEITDATFEILEGNFIAEPADVTGLLGTDDLAAHMNEKVVLKGLTVEASQDADGNEAAFLYSYDGSGTEGSDLYFNVSLNGATYTFTVESYLTGADTDVYQAVKALQVGDTIDVEGFLYWYEGVQPHVTAVMPA